ncbi:mechanosensitive ion channel protein MscS [Dyella jiangningensis]|nr:mechanosensitive ion channel protein MscS [Dyella jiangningensis]
MPNALRLLLILLFAVAGASPAFAQNNNQAPAQIPQATLATPDQLSAQLDQIKQSITDKGKLTDTILTDARSKTAAVQQQADQLAASLVPQVDAMKAKLDVLGAAPAKGAPPEAPEVAAQRKQLTKDKTDLDGQLTQAKSLSLESQQLITQIAGLRRDLFQAQVFQRTASPLAKPFWSRLAQNLPDDRASLGVLGASMQGALAQAWQPANRVPFILCLLTAVALLVAGRRLLEHKVLDLASKYLPAGHLRRSALALIITLITMLTYGLAAWLIYLAVNWNGVFDEELDDLTKPLVELTFIAASMAGIGRAMLSVRRPSWRLPPISDDLAKRLSLFPALLALSVLLLGIVEQITGDIGASLGTAMAANALASTVIGLLLASALVRMGKARRALIAGGGTPAKRPLWVGLLVAAAFITTVIVLAGVLTGYIALAFFMARQAMRAGFLIALLYLLMHLINDLCESLLSPDSRSGQRLQDTFGIAPARLEQTATVISGVVRAFLLLLAVPLILAPYGSGTSELIDRGSQLFAGRSLGTLTINPTNIFNAMLVLLVGGIVVRLLKRWLSTQLLPKTSLDVGMQTSIVTLLGYVGGVLVFVLVLGALKVDVQSIAWVASALSVGIGFGLQAIVQNFISGLILLAERPVKVGDWVSIAGVEGDVRRINVRATEIQQGDRSTVIVPNSQLITQNVRNVTMANAKGRVQIRLPMPLSTDPAKVRQIVFDILRNHPSTLETPSPSVQLDSIDSGSLMFVCTAYVTNPRDGGNVKSDLLFEIINRLRESNMPLTTPQDMVVHTMHPENTVGTPQPTTIMPGTKT